MNQTVLKTEVTLVEEEVARAGVYGLIGALLAAAPDSAVFDLLESVTASPNDTDLPWQEIKTAAANADSDAVVDEYHALFIGIGRGELLPYASTYLTGFLQEQPLADVRKDLARLGFARQAGVHEPEDHAGALCQVMAALVASPEEFSFDDQHVFFSQHIGPWMGEFFSDLAAAEQADFYQSVARFGLAFIEIEKRYFSMEV
ncbi:MAG: molecular chaperone TorD family protein [Pseudomonadota bacterium]|nr:molecular chaperone TorD family protein [Pseudomonadota bacterium]